MPICRLYDLQNKDVINLTDGRRLGQTYDLEFDEDTGQIVSLIVPGRPRFFGLLGRGPELVIGFSDIKKIGFDSVLVEIDSTLPEEPSLFRSFFFK
ncbi:MAG TPA: YlmC/YmxH family sporulation protein [Clostridiales bacterium]|jgi:YlmC/YmxH family sporulation protein|nr:YlmC/YmxH family sporulation protein [Clostridiales bacterium]